ncbi:hypothetical protein Z517_01763 [Fonsecaea pedrosoi CBS 271.37]|uniref:FAD-dependent oxidoreductase 2 FAD-binding domain-containing protein n=1 Tax=Fonsecaea pedrosoi CBS 271.37 TaxID=1442368 RepID=A0A0D2FI67_9EURO|nr:uncharacterized protein Z517_01763 [Fonsecaea pedrosoi CBS 271.37]KIW86367.1 hypothetical protein Z517_01763 [Fonsecaea pedrosoi CBS 271.37]
MLRSSARTLATAARSAPKPLFDASYDVVVVGSGAAGLTAAVTAAKKHGLKVLVTEKAKYFGGTTAFSGGGAWLPNNHHQHTLGVTDSKEKATTYLRGVVGSRYDNRTINGFLDNAPRMAKWIDDNTALKFFALPLPDYYTSLDGATQGRTLVASPFDGRKLGGRLKDIRYALQGFKAFESMQVAFDEVPIMANPLASTRNLAHVVAKLQRYMLDLLRYGKGSLLANGNAIVGSLVYTIAQSGGDLWNNSPATELVTNGGRVEGVVVAKDGREIRVRATKGVLLASGGFGRAKEARAFVPHEYCLSPSSVTGDGIRLAQAAGAILPDPSPDNAIYSPVSILQPRHGPIRMYPHFGYDRAKPGSIVVDTNGQRFINESVGYHQFVQHMHAAKMTRCFMIADKRFLSKYGIGFALADPYPKGKILSQNYLVSAKTIPQLAAKLGIPEDNLVQTVKRCNENAARGKDPDFGRGDSVYDHVFGDPTNKPTVSLGTCDQAPFYAVPMYPGNVSTQYGLRTDEYARVMGQEEKPIDGLYAAGNDSNSVWRGTYPAGGSSIGPAMTFGYVAAEHMASN